MTLVLLHGDCITVTGKTIAENKADVTFPTNQDIVRTTAEPLSPTGGVVGLRGNLAPRRRFGKSGWHESLDNLPAQQRCFDCEEDAFAAVELRDYKEGDVLVIRYEGPKGGPGMREMLDTTAALIRPRSVGIVVGADHGWSIFRCNTRVCNWSCWA